MQINLRPDISDALDRFIAEQPEPKLSRELAVEIALENFLISMGLLDIPPDDEAELQ